MNPKMLPGSWPQASRWRRKGRISTEKQAKHFRPVKARDVSGATRRHQPVGSRAVEILATLKFFLSHSIDQVRKIDVTCYGLPGRGNVASRLRDFREGAHGQ
jgi:hypothetical protein